MKCGTFAISRVISDPDVMKTRIQPNDSHHYQELNVKKLVALSTILILAFSIIGLANHTVHAATPAFTFTNYEIARSWDQAHAGVTCPNSGTNCWNWHGEPNIATAPDGTIYASSENTAFNHISDCNGSIVTQFLYICGGTGAWKSTDQGNHFTTLTSPNTIFPVSGTPLTFWGGDTHIAVAPAKNAANNPQYNVYVVSLEAAGSGLIGVGESTSKDGGTTWSGPTNVPVTIVNPSGAPGVQDRPWVAGYGADEVCVESHTGAAVPGVFCSFNDGLAFTQSAPALDAAHSWLTAETSIPGALHIDPNTGTIYVPFSGVANPTEALADSSCAPPTIPCAYGNHVVYMAVSKGIVNGLLAPFIDYPVYINPNTQTNYGEQFVAMALDSSGNPYEVYSDGVSLFYSYSTSNGQAWNGPFQVNQAPSKWAIEPWATAGTPGHIDIVWYGSSNCGDHITDVDNCQNSATWNVYFAQNSNAFSTPSGFTQVAASGTNHMGPVCLGGGFCQSFRGLFDDFGVTSDPVTGLATIVYDNDMYTPNDPSNLPNQDCTSQYTTPSDPAQQNCVHTDIAHQTSGFGIAAPPCRESDGQGDFQGVNGKGNFLFDRDGCLDGDHDSVDSSNRGDGKDFHSTTIDSVLYDDTAHTMTVAGLGTVNGLPVAYTLVALETGLATPGWVSFSFSDGYTNAGLLTSGSIQLH